MDKEESKNTNKKKSLKTIGIVGTIILCIIILLLVIFFCSGKTTTTGGDKDVTITNRINCTSNTVIYPFFDHDNSEANRPETKIDVIFKDSVLSSLSLIYKLHYSSADEITVSEAFNHAAMNISFSNKGLGPDALNATYNKLKDNLQFSIYASGSELEDSALEYFMLNPEDKANYNDEFIANYYINMGMNCQITK